MKSISYNTGHAELSGIFFTGISDFGEVALWALRPSWPDYFAGREFGISERTDKTSASVEGRRGADRRNTSAAAENCRSMRL